MKVCDFLKRHISVTAIATDINCMFPTEGEDFDKTMKLVDKYKFQLLNIS